MGELLMKLLKQLCSIIVVFALLFGAFPVCEFAYADSEETPGSSDESNPSSSRRRSSRPGSDSNRGSENTDNTTSGDDQEAPADTAKTDDSNKTDDTDKTDDDKDQDDKNDTDKTDDTDNIDDDVDEEDIDDDTDEIDEEEDIDDEIDEEEDDIPPDVFQVILPTTGSLDFVIDPLGLAGLKEGESARPHELDSGRIYPKSDIAAFVINESTMPIKLEVTLKAVNTIYSGNNDDRVNFVRSKGTFDKTRSAVFDDNEKNVLLYAVPSRLGIGSLFDAYYPSNIGFVLAESNTMLTFLLPAAEYIRIEDFIEYEEIDENEDIDKNVIKNVRYELLPGSGHGTQVRVGGYINDHADWSAYTATRSGRVNASIGITAVFTITRLDNDEFELYSQPVGNAMYLRTTFETGLYNNTVILDEESQDALIPHRHVNRSNFRPSNSTWRRKR